MAHPRRERDISENYNQENGGAKLYRQELAGSCRAPKTPSRRLIGGYKGTSLIRRRPLRLMRLINQGGEVMLSLICEDSYVR